MAGYYIHLEPAHNVFFVCAGLYNPTKEVLQSVREQIMLEPDEFQQAILDCGPDFKLNWDSALKRMPLGYKETDKCSEYYRLRSYEIYKTLTQEDVLDKHFMTHALDSLKRCYNFNELLNKCFDYAYDPDK